MASLSTGGPASKTMPKVHRALEVKFVKSIETNNFRARFNIGGLSVRWFLIWIIFSNIVIAKQIVELTRAKARAHLKSLKFKTFASVLDFYLQETGTDQVCQILMASLALATYAEKEPLLQNFLYHLSVQTKFCGSNRKQWLFADCFEPCMLRHSCYVEHHTHIRSRGSHIFHNKAMVKGTIHAKNQKSSREYSTETLIYCI